MFSASHSLQNLAEGHPCCNLHGHNYEVIIELRSEKLIKTGFVLDYRDLTPVKKYLDTFLDHKHLNDVLLLVNPTAELIALHLYETFKPTIPALYAVEVSETPKTSARYEH